MYEGFERFEIQTSDPEVKIVGRVGGKGPAVLLLHGNPLTHVHWHLVAPRLAKDFTVVATTCVDTATAASRAASPTAATIPSVAWVRISSTS